MAGLSSEACEAHVQQSSKNGVDAIAWHPSAKQRHRQEATVQCSTRSRYAQKHLQGVYTERLTTQTCAYAPPELPSRDVLLTNTQSSMRDVAGPTTWYTHDPCMCDEPTSQAYTCSVMRKWAEAGAAMWETKGTGGHHTRPQCMPAVGGGGEKGEVSCFFFSSNSD